MAPVERGFSSELAAELAGMLDWWRDAGVDTLVADTPRAWLVAPVRSGGGDAGGGSAGPMPGEGALPLPAISGRAPATPPGNVAAPLPDQLDLFQAWLRDTADLPYAASGAPRVCPAGDPAAGLMVMTAMPSNEDCAAGRLLTGTAGRLFDRMMTAIGRDRGTLYLAGLSGLRPGGGRFDATGAARYAEIARHHVALAAPKALLLMGDDVAKALVGSAVAQARGRVHHVGPAGVPAIVTFHPDFLLSQPAAKPRAWADLQLLMDLLA